MSFKELTMMDWFKMYKEDRTQLGFTKGLTTTDWFKMYKEDKTKLGFTV